MSDYVKDVKDASVDSRFQKEYTLEFRAEERGMERGIERGIEQGVSQKAKEVAETMLKDDEPIEKIMKYSGLSEQEIKEINKDLKI